MTALESYARKVLDGDIVACKKIKQIYERLLNDLYNPGVYHFDEDKAQRPIEFIERFCKQSQGKLGEGIVLAEFQRAMIQAFFGFVDDEGYRRYNELLCIIARKNGKTTLMAALELYLLLADGEGAPEIYNVATRLDQSKKGYDECVRMIRHSPALSKMLRKRQSDIYCSYNLGIIKALAANTNGLDGLNASGVIIDELAAIKNRDLYDLMKQSMGAGSRRQPALIQITTNGFVRESIFDAQYEYAKNVLDGAIEAPRFLPIIYELDDAKEYSDATQWIKANPGLGTIKSTAFLTECVQKGQDDPSFMPTLMVKDFNIKQTSASAWLRYEELNNEQLFNAREFDYAIGGIDAADTTDLAAAVAVFQRPNDARLYVRSMFWLPETVMEQTGRTGSRRERDNAPYELWSKQGYLRLAPGNRVDKICFLDWFRELRDDEDIYTLYIGYDPWHMDDSLLRAFKAEFGNKAMIPVRQGAQTCSEPIKNLRAEFLAHNVVYNNNPILKWNLINADVKSDINGNVQLIKCNDPRRRIDGADALVDAYKVLQDVRDDYINLNKEAP